ncbi:DUF2067 family protein [Vulcanisaeta thermophila]|uniref:DUF2067 family protein n=1 Tax=Vulcanisaeta thermophila TaxID=867917 RepID=UPI000853AD19|nr:DUF2067 family protein [Vulcanisaeta thermophila]
MRRDAVFTFLSMDEAMLFIDMVSKRIKGKSLMIKYQKASGNIKVRVSIEGDAAELSLLYDELMRVYKDVKMAKSRGAIRAFDVSIILNRARLSAAIPLDLVVDLLQLMGRRAELRGSKLVVDMDLEDLVSLVERVSEIYKELMNTNVSSQGKRIVAIYSILRGKGVKESIDDLVRHGLLTRYGNTDFLVMTLDYQHSLTRLQSIIEGSG